MVMTVLTSHSINNIRSFVSDKLQLRSITFIFNATTNHEGTKVNNKMITVQLVIREPRSLLDYFLCLICTDLGEIL